MNARTEPGVEHRAFTAVRGLRIERREGKAPMLAGHAAVFNQLSENLGGFREQIKPGAFSDAVLADDVRALFNHDRNFVLGRSTSGTLRMREDDVGLAVEIDVPDTASVRDQVLAPIERGDVSQMSIGFQVKPGGQDWAEDDEGRLIRTLTSVRLFDVSPVTFAAYPQTDVAIRSLDLWRSQRARPNLLKAQLLQTQALI